MRIYVVGGLAFFALLSSALATPIGGNNPGSDLTTDGGGCGPGGTQVRVTGTSIDWEPIGGGTGCIVTGSGTNVIYSTGVLGEGVSGTIRDLPSAIPVVGFMTFAAHPDLSFDLYGIGPGSSNTVCAGLANGASCSIELAPGVISPFLLTRSGSQTIVSLLAFGLVTDTTGSSNWSGSFSVSISTMTPEQIETEIKGGGFVSSTHSGDFDITLIPEVPEPSTFAMLGLGLVAAGLLRKRLS